MMDDKEQPVIQDNDFKYILQDTGAVCLGARFCYEELLLQERVPFKLKTVISRYLLEEVDPATTLESHFYYMTEDSFAGRTCLELRVKVKVSLPERKKGLTGKTKLWYVERVYPLKEFVRMDPQQKEKLGLIVREIIFPRLALMSFTV